ncbi:protein naked cuticle homolog 2 [Microplitis mediator]|uniref:protein naked cuticle homolog 2 n=1 Tax=Microplitis mediator TaxID=375433 RepID=UPI0025559648|nr:protein naked cuticle homolog 2 [Microplitis mediator]
MATGLVKWWRTRFLAGYKPFSVVGGIAEGSDSEELLSASVPSDLNSTSLPPSATLNTATSTSSLVSVSVPVIVPETLLPEPLIPEILPPSSSARVSPVIINNTIPSTSASASAPTTTATTTTPAVVSSTTNNDEQPAVSNTRQFSFEEFECDVSVAEDNRRRQEFSFTLYDFDGHGKITKDDIAGLVTSIYDTLGTSIEVPPCGSKTIKVKLTVSPDKNVDEGVGGVSNSGGGIDPGTGEAQTPAVKKTPTVLIPTTSVVNASTSCCHIKPVKSCSHATHANRRVPRRRRILRNRAQTELIAEWHSEEDVDNVPGNISKQEELRRRVGGGSVHVPTPYSNSSEGDVSDDSDFSPTVTPFTPLVTTNHRKRSGSMQRQQLLEIIQANMEKNNLSFHASRKRHQSEHLRVPLQRPYAAVSPMSPMYVQTSSRPPSASRQPPPAYHKPVREYSHHHATSLSKLPAKARDNQRKIQNHNSHTTTNFSSSIDTNITVPTTITAATTPTHQHQHQHQQPNSNSNKHHYRNNLQSTIMTTPTTANTVVGHNIFNTESIQKNHINNQRNNDHAHHNYVQSLKQQKASVNNNNNNSSSKASKKHQLKHATREQEQARAMQQVVRWLEQEFSSQNPDNDTNNTGRRHVHEHIHHHYHHYHADPVV